MKRLLTLSAFLIAGIALFAHDLVHNGVYYRITDNTNPNMPTQRGALPPMSMITSI